jgi:hypothetical protein
MVWHQDGAKDAYYTEGGLFQEYDYTKQSYVNKSELFNLDGQGKNCQFDPTAGVCKNY